jgi:hypothetical protein
MGRCSRRGSLKAAFRWWYQAAPSPTPRCQVDEDQTIQGVSGIALLLQEFRSPEFFEEF